MTKLLLVLLTVTPLLAQETPTERQAASDVLRKMDALEKSLDIPDLVTHLTASNAERDQVVARAKQLMDTEMLALGDEITRDPEIGFQEDRAVRKLTQVLQKHGFETEVGIAGLRTAFIGRYRRKNSTAANHWTESRRHP